MGGNTYNVPWSGANPTNGEEVEPEWSIFRTVTYGYSLFLLINFSCLFLMTMADILDSLLTALIFISSCLLISEMKCMMSFGCMQTINWHCYRKVEKYVGI